MNSATPPVSGTDWTSHLSVPCTRISTWFSGFPSCSRLPPPLQTLGQFIYSPEGRASAAASESGLGNQSELLWGIPGAQTHDPSWKRTFQKVPFGHSVATAPFLGSRPVSLAPCVYAPEALFCLPFLFFPQGWERNL